MAVVVPDETDDYRGLAEEIASERGDEVLTDVGEAGDGELLFVASPDTLRSGQALALQERLVERGPERGRFGIITGLTRDLARDLYDRDPDERENDCILLRREDRDIRSPDEDTSVLNRSDATRENLLALNDSGLASLSATIDGQASRVFLSDGQISGLPGPDVEFPPFEVPSPTYLLERERDLVRGGDAIGTATLDVPHVFLSSCASTIPRTSPLGLPAHLGMGLLVNSASVIGGYRPMSGLPTEAALHHALFRAGYDAAERCYLLNRNARALDLEAFPYVLFGRPGHRCQSSSELAYEYTTGRADGAVELTVTDVSTHVIDVRVDGAREHRLLQNVNEDHSGWPIFYTTFPEGEDLRVLVYSWGRMDVDEFRFRLVEPPSEGRTKLERTRRSLTNAERLEGLGMLDRKASGQISNVENKLNGVTEDFRRRSYDANAHFAITDRLDGIEDDVGTLRDRLVSLLADRGPGFLLDDYADRVLAQDVSVHDENCPYCGRPVFAKRVEHVRGSAERYVGMCPRCINVFEVPATSSSPHYPRIDGDLVFGPSGTGPVEFEFTNPADVPVEATFYPWLWADDNELRGTQVSDPETATVDLQPGETHTQSFELDTAPLDRGNYTLYAYVIANMALFVSQRRLLVVEEPDRHRER